MEIPTLSIDVPFVPIKSFELIFGLSAISILVNNMDYSLINVAVFIKNSSKFF